MGPSGSSFLGRGTRGVGHLNGKRRERSVSKFLLQPKGLTSPPGYCGYIQHLNLSRKRGIPFKVCRISPFLALNAHSAPGSRLVFQRFSLGTHRFSSRRTEETVAGDRLRPRRGCKDACNPLIFRKTLRGGGACPSSVRRTRPCLLPPWTLLSASEKPRMSTLHSAFKMGSSPPMPAG